MPNRNINENYGKREKSAWILLIKRGRAIFHHFHRVMIAGARESILIFDSNAYMNNVSCANCALYMLNIQTFVHYCERIAS